MIYRFLTECNPVCFYASDKGYGGACTVGGLQLPRIIPFPLLRDLRAKFYFTEEGYKAVSKHLNEQAKFYGIGLRVIKRKTPKKSQVVYSDKYQVAIIEKEKKKRNRKKDLQF